MRKPLKMPIRLIYPEYLLRGRLFEVWAAGAGEWWLANDLFELDHDDFCPPLTAVEVSRISADVNAWYH